MVASPLHGELALLVSPNATDAEFALGFLHAQGIDARSFPDLRSATEALDERSGCLVLIDHALVTEDLPALRRKLRQLPEWFDLPLILVARNAGEFAGIVAQAFPRSGNVTLLERPLNPHTFTSAVEVALRATARQREIGELLEQRDQAVRLRDEFLAMLAHELRNPLAPMRNALYLLRRADLREPGARSSLDILQRQLDHIVRMVDDLMDVARLERGKVVLKKQCIDLNQSVAAATDTCRPFAQQQGHRIVSDFHADALPVEADTVRIEQIVCNLLHNAAKFTQAPGPIRVQTAAEAGRAQIIVEDQGIGFAPDSAAALFDPFLQVNPGLDRAGSGLGMGLTIAKRLAELHGGSIEASSEGPGKGARFVVRLPLLAAATASAEVASGAETPPVPRRVVVVEDNADIRSTLDSMLRMWGHQVDSAADGVAGLDCILRLEPDIALIDIGLPGMNGYDIARAVRRRRPGKAIMLVAVTGYGQPTDLRASTEAGFDGHLLKPVEPEVLERLLARLG
jgi:signal transduction histidine kinase